MLHAKLLAAGQDLGPWYDHPATTQMLFLALNPEEVAEFRTVDPGKIGWAQITLERKFLEHMTAVISGRESAESGLEQAARIAEAVRQLDGRAHA